MEPRRVVSSAYSLIVLADVSVDQRGCVTAGGRCTWIGNLDFEGVGCAGGSQVLDGRGEVVWTPPGTVTKAFHARAGDNSFIAGHGERQHIGSVKVEAGAVEVILDLTAQGAIGGSGDKETEIAETARDVDPAVAGPLCRAARRRSITDGDGDGGGGGGVTGGIASDGGERVRTVGSGGGIPTRRIRRGRTLGTEIDAVEVELNADNTDIVGGGRGSRDRSRSGCASRRAGDRDSGWCRIRWRSIIHGDGDGGGGGAVAGGIASDGGERVRTAGSSGGIPIRRIRRGRILGAQIDAVEFELNAADSDIVRSCRCRRDCPGNSGAVRRAGDGDSRWRGIRRRSIIHGDSHRRGGGAVACGIAGDGGERVRTIGSARGIPARRIGRGRILCTQIDAVEFELKANDTHVVGSSGRNSDRGRNRGPIGRATDRYCRRCRIGRRS